MLNFNSSYPLVGFINTSFSKDTKVKSTLLSFRIKTSNPLKIEILHLENKAICCRRNRNLKHRRTYKITNESPSTRERAPKRGYKKKFILRINYKTLKMCYRRRYLGKKEVP